MHFRDLLNLKPSSHGAEGISNALRYTNTEGELFYTIHADNISIWQTEPYYAVSRRLDLENTRSVEDGERAVLGGASKFGEEPMVWNLVNAEFGIFEHHNASRPAWEGVDAYHSLPSPLLAAKDKEGLPTAPECLLVTLTYKEEGREAEEGTEPPQRLLDLRAVAVNHLSSGYSANDKAYTSMYRYIPGAQPDMHPAIAEGADGEGSWVACVLVQGEVSQAMRVHLKVGLEDSVDEMRRREGETRERRLGWGVRVGVWKGEVFMSQL